jgi:hypothetical protein
MSITVVRAPCPRSSPKPTGKRRRVYLRWAAPFELLQESPHRHSSLRPGITLAERKPFAQTQSDTESRSGHAAGQAQTLPELPTEIGRINSPSPRLPLVGDRLLASIRRRKTQNQNLSKRKPRYPFGGSACLPLVGLEPSQYRQKGDSAQKRWFRIS